ncbi:hypothetical protein Pelo_6836 [Pelomyxa schiedti]|nr:hypothetical protein Pelo_6836 [Pelomyxa schiedti]
MKERAPSFLLSGNTLVTFLRSTRECVVLMILRVPLVWVLSTSTTRNDAADSFGLITANSISSGLEGTNRNSPLTLLATDSGITTVVTLPPPNSHLPVSNSFHTFKRCVSITHSRPLRSDVGRSPHLTNHFPLAAWNWVAIPAGSSPIAQNPVPS